MLIMAVRAAAPFAPLGFPLLPAVPSLRGVVRQYYIARAAFAAFVDYNIERMGSMSRERHTCVWSNGQCASPLPLSPAAQLHRVAPAAQNPSI